MQLWCYIASGKAYRWNFFFIYRNLFLLSFVALVRNKYLYMMWQVDPYLCLVEDSRLQAIYVSAYCEKEVYGSEENEAVALSYLKARDNNGEKIKEMVMSHLTQKFKNLPEVKCLTMHASLSLSFSFSLCGGGPCVWVLGEEGSLGLFPSIFPSIFQFGGRWVHIACACMVSI